MTASSTHGRRKSRARQTAPRLDPVTQYARQVQDGRVVAGRAVRLACHRHLTDLAQQGTEAFPYCFDPGAAQHIINFFPRFLTLENGQPFTLTPWMQFCWGSIFGWKHATDGRRRFQAAYICTGKGSGKTPSLAGVGLYGLAFDDEEAAEIYSAGFDRQQASITLNDAIRMAQDSPDLAAILDIGKYNLAHSESRSFFRAVSSEHRSKSGPRPHMALVDEVHEHRDGTIINKLRAGFKGRRQPLHIEITNAGHDRTSICWQHHQHSLSVLEGALVDEQWFAYVCQLDPCDACFADGYRQPKDGCPHCDDWTNPLCWPKTNPSLGITIQPAYLQTQVDQAVAMPSDQALIKRLNFCLWTESHQTWISSDQWNACRVEAVSPQNDAARPCAAGLDLSSKWDLTALVVAVRIDDPPSDDPAEVVAIEGLDVTSGTRVSLPITLNFCVELTAFFWLPEETLRDRVRTERIPYDVWQRAGKLVATAGAVIDHQVIYDAIVHDIWKPFRIQRLGYDERDATMLAVKLRDDARLGDSIVAVPQGKRLSEAFKLLEVLIRSRRLRHDGHPVLGWTFANAEPRRDRLGALWIEKPSETKRIDGAQAAAIALSQLMLLPARRPRRRGALIWTPEGFVTYENGERVSV